MKAEILTPALTIFNDDGTIDYPGNQKLIAHLIDNGVDGIVPLGSTGEFTGIEIDERKKFLKFYLDEVGGRVKVLCGTGCVDYRDTIKLSNYALENGADGVLLISQYYFAMTQEEMFHYYDKLAEGIKGDIYLYNFPARTGTDFTPETVLRLVKKHKNIVGMKESVPMFGHTRDIMFALREERPDFKMYSGFDDQFSDNVIYGGIGTIGALSNLVPRLWADWAAAVNDKNVEDASRLKKGILTLMKLYALDSNTSGLFKAILKERGLDINTTTLFPFDEVRPESVKEGLEIIKTALEDSKN